MWMRLTERMKKFIQKVGCCIRKERFISLRDKEVGGLDMVTTDEDQILRQD